MKPLFRVACARHIVRNALTVSAVVGTVLNMINQCDAFLAIGTVSGFHLFLNYLVPYCVASYSAAKNELTRNDNND